MDAVVYPESSVVGFIQQNMVPIRIQLGTEPYSNHFNVKWTPTLITLDTEGKEHHRTTGFLAPDELIPSLLLGIAKSHFDREQFTEAMTTIETLLKGHPKSDSAPEAIYLRGVSQYKNTDDPKPLKDAYEKLRADYPDNQWTKRAYPYRLL